MSFVHLHVHTTYSLLDGAIRIPELLSTAQAMNMPAVAITDHGQMFAALNFYKSARAAGLKPIVGVEAYVASRGRRRREPGDPRYHLILLAQNLEGYRNLCRLTSKANIQGFYHRPRIDMELLKEYNQGLICLSACLQGQIPQAILRGAESEARQLTEEHARVFPGRFYLELQKNGLPEQETVNEGLLHLAKTAGLGLVATNDCHYLLKEHHDVHDVLLCVQTGKTIAEPNRMRFTTREFYFKSPGEMARDFAGLPAEALDNTLLIAGQCDLEFPKPQYAFPAIKLEGGETVADRLASLSRSGLEERFASWAKIREVTVQDKDAYRERLENEIKLIVEMGFPGYFLIVADFIQWAKKRGIPVGPGRGSAAGSLVAYALKITDIDPIPYGLLFERFLNPERISMPDIDVDFCTNGRDEVIRYVTDNYGGKERVAQIITFGQMKAKAVIRDVARAMGLTYNEADRIAKMIPNRLNITLDEALREEPRLAQAAREDENITRLLEYAKLLENMPRHASTHAAGVVIGDKPLMEHLPLYCDPSTEELAGEKVQVITQFDMKGVEEIGLIKFDFLGLKTLTLIDQCLALLKQRGLEISLEHLDQHDQATYKLLSRGDSTGVFQLESSGMREILVKLKPNRIEDLIALVALYRPGPLKSGMVDQFIDGKHGRRRIVYELPQLEPILKETYGVILYQEQVMRISQVLANYSLGEADLLRRAMGKKKPEEMAQQRQRFMDGAKENSLDPDKAARIFDLMANFAEYGFNKSHSAAYAVIAYQTAYLKANYPVEFMAALMTSEKDNQDKIVRLISESRAAGHKVLPPDINQSGPAFTVAGDLIRFGLGAIKGVGQAAIDSIIEARAEGPFENLFDFCDRVDSQKVNRRVIEALIKCGAFDDSGGAGRSKMMAALDEALEHGLRLAKERRDGQESMFGVFEEAEPAPLTIRWPSVPEWRESQRLSCEKECLGFFITGHPLDKYAAQLTALTTATAARLPHLADKAEVRLGGVVAKVTAKIDKHGKRFAYATLEDLTGSAELLIWSDIYEKSQELLAGEEPVMVWGQVDNSERAGQATIKVIVREIATLSQALERKAQSLVFHIDLGRLDERDLQEFKELLAAQNGGGPVSLVKLYVPGKGAVAYPTTCRVTPSQEFMARAQRLLGPEAVEIRY